MPKTPFSCSLDARNKGGANLRYFFASERYSEDIDLDLIRPVPWSLEDQVDAALGSPALRGLLAIGDLALAEHTSAKQTETTHRWKIGIQVPGGSAPVRSKVEFSNRDGGEGDYALAFLPDAVVEPYALRPPSVQHYDAAAATAQKDYAAFRDQVLPFLESDAAELVASPGAWEQIQAFVADRLDAAR